MKKTAKVMSAAALLATTVSVAVAQDVPLNTTVAGGQGTEQLQGQGETGFGLLSSTGALLGLAAVTLLGAAASDTSSGTDG